MNITKEQFNGPLSFNFLTNNVKGLQSCKKRVKIFEYFRNKVAPKSILLLQEAHSSVDSKNDRITNLRVN